MDVNSIQSYLDNISVLIADEDKIVTYKSFSKSFGIHVNTSKQLLYSYYCEEKSKNTFPISATYLLAGKLNDGSFIVTIVNEEDLSKARSNFVEVTTEHIYSLQKGRNLKDIKVLSAVKSEEPSKSSIVIKCSKSNVKVRKEISKSENREEENKKVLKQAFTQEKAVCDSEKTAEKPKADVSEAVKNTEMVQKTSPRKNAGKTQINNKKTGGNIVNLFAKAAQKNAEKPVNKKEKTSQKDIPVELAENDRECEEQKSVKTEKKNLEILQTSFEKESPEKRSRSSETYKRKKVGNKRKRIQMLSDSEDSDSSNDKDDNEISDVNTEENQEDNVPSTIELEDEKEDKQNIPKNKRKKRKVVDRTIMNEDGYLETKKEVVFETDSENEVETVSVPVEQKKPKTEAKGSNAAQSSKASKKQVSLLSFFKKN